MQTTLNNSSIKKEIISLKKVKSATEIKQLYFTSESHHSQQIIANQNYPEQILISVKKQQNYSKNCSKNDFHKEQSYNQKLELMNTQNLSKLGNNKRLANKQRLKKICLISSLRTLTDQQSSTEQSSLQKIEYVNEQYQLNSETSFKKVRFSEKLIKKEPPRQSILQRKNNKNNKIKSPSILKNSVNSVLNQSIYSQTERSYSIQNSFQVRRKIKFGNSIDNNSNKIVKQKYQKISASLNKQFYNGFNQKTNKIQFLSYSLNEDTNKSFENIPEKFKFKDQIFPPVFSSLCRVIGNKKQEKKQKNIQWIRLTDLFKHKKCKVFNNCSQTYSQITIYKSDNGFCSDIILGCFNAIKNNKILLQAIFQKQEQVNPFGIYLVKICIGTAWKYIIIDDFIPVIKNQTNNQFQPAFLNIQLQDQEPNFQNPLYIWPFLLEKAYASYYSCYEALKLGTETDFLAQITDSTYQIIQLNNLEKQENLSKNQLFNDIRVRIKQKNVVFIGFSDQDLPYVPLKFENYHNQLEEQFLTYYDPLSNYLPFKIKLIQLDKLFSSIYIYPLKQFQFKSTCLIYPPKILNKTAKKEVLQQKNIKNNINIKTTLKQIDPVTQSVSIRSFATLSITKCNIIVSQRQNRFYFSHKYIWNRVFILLKEYNNSFRWIYGQYKNSKTINFKGVLNPGQYYIIVMPEWKQQHNRQITIMMHSDNQFINFERKIYNSKQRIIEQGCMDLAQRQGKLIQINKFICSYNLLYEQCALIIQNICNQRPNGQVTVMRSISGLKSKLQIIPVNQQFYIQLQKQTSQKNQSLAYHQQEQQRNICRSLYMKEQIEVQISSLDHYTVVLKMKGGIDKRFFKAFKF